MSQFESGASRPSAKATESLASLLEVPPAFFHIPATDTHEGFFRLLRRTSMAERRRARALAFIAHDIAHLSAAEPDLPAPSVPALPLDDLDAARETVEEWAASVRRKMAAAAPANP